MLRRVAGVVALAASVVLTGQGTALASTPSHPAVHKAHAVKTAAKTAPTGTVVMIIRHGEKPDGNTPGYDASGREDDHSLTKAGWQRARALVGVFAGHVHPGLARPTRIYAAGANDGHEGARTRETVTPLAAALGVPVTSTYGRHQEKALAAQVAAAGGSTLISWQHTGIPDLVRAFPGVTPPPPSSWSNDRFDAVWTLTKTPTGWHFAQVPELAMPGDHRS